MRRSMRELTIALVAALALGGCQTAHWEKPMASQEAIATDMADCEHQARREAFYQSWRVSPYFFYPSPYPRGSIAESQWRWQYQNRIDNDRYFREQQLGRFCMRNKGYQLVPDEPAKP